MKAYYEIARRMHKMGRQDSATALRKFHQQIVEQVVEQVVEILAANGCDQSIVDEVNALEPEGEKFATDRTHLRRAEAILYAMLHEPQLMHKLAVERAFNEGHGVDVITSSQDPQWIRILRQDGKYRGL